MKNPEFDYHQFLQDSECLHDKQQVETALDQLAVDITEKLERVNLLCLTVLQGGLVPAGMLLPRLKFDLEIDYVHATRYLKKTVGGELTWIAKPRVSLENRSVLLIDDIHDEGTTLSAIKEACKEMGAKQVLSAVLVNKIHDRKKGGRADFVGLNVDDRYVFGCGMDYKGYMRNVDGIYAVNEND